MKTHRPITATHHSITKKTTGFSSQHPLWIRPISSSTIRIAEQSSGNLIGDHEETIRIEQEQIKSVAQIKSNLYGALQGTQITYFSFLAHSHTYIISAKFYWKKKIDYFLAGVIINKNFNGQNARLINEQYHSAQKNS